MGSNCSECRAAWAAVLLLWLGTASIGAVTCAAATRTVDGSGNHPLGHGSADTPLMRTMLDAYPAPGDGSAMRAAPNPRAISNAVADQTVAEDTNARNLSSMFWQWGQFLDHDITLVLADQEPMAIDVTGDPVFDPDASGEAISAAATTACPCTTS
jgi:hypothetical protein